MIIVTANVGLLPFEIGKKGAYITDNRVGFFNSARAQLNLRRFHHPGDNRGAESAQLRWRDWHERAAGWPGTTDGSGRFVSGGSAPSRGRKSVKSCRARIVPNYSDLGKGNRKRE